MKIEYFKKTSHPELSLVDLGTFIDHIRILFIVKMKLDWRIFRNPKSWDPSFYVKDFFSYQTCVLRAVGMCHTDFTKYLPATFAFLSPLINYTIFVGMSLVILHVNILFIIEFLRIFRTGSLEEVTSLITMIIISSFSFFNILFYQFAYKKYLRIVEYSNVNFQRRSAFGVTCLTGERTYLLAKRFTVFWTISCLCGTFQWVVAALYTGKHPLNVVYPMLDARKTPYYEIIFLLHTGCQYITGGSFACASNVLFSLSVTICGQFDMLFCSLKNLRYTAMVMSGTQLDKLKYNEPFFFSIFYTIIHFHLLQQMWNHLFICFVDVFSNIQ